MMTDKQLGIDILDKPEKYEGIKLFLIAEKSESFLLDRGFTIIDFEHYDTYVNRQINIDKALGKESVVKDDSKIILKIVDYTLNLKYIRENYPNQTFIATSFISDMTYISDYVFGCTCSPISNIYELKNRKNAWD